LFLFHKLKITVNYAIKKIVSVIPKKMHFFNFIDVNHINEIDDMKFESAYMVDANNAIY